MGLEVLHEKTEAIKEARAATAPIKPNPKGTRFITTSDPYLKKTKYGEAVMIDAERIDEDGKLAGIDAAWFPNETEIFLLEEIVDAQGLEDLIGQGFVLYGDPYETRINGKKVTAYENRRLETFKAPKTTQRKIEEEPEKPKPERPKRTKNKR